MSNLLQKIFNFFQSHKTFLWLFLAVIVVLLAWSASQISFVEDISSFLPNNADNQRINEAYQKIGGANKIVVKFVSQVSNGENQVSSVEYQGISNDELLSEAAIRFAEILQESDSAGHIKKLMYEVDNEKISEVSDFITQNIPFFLDEEDYARIDSLIQPQNIENQLKADKELLLSPMGGFVRNVILRDPLHFSQKALKNLENFKQNDNYNSDNGFIFNNKGECIVTIESQYPVSETANNKLLANEIYSAVNQTEKEFSGAVKIIPFGAALVSLTNAEQIKNDSIFAVIVAMILILALLFYFFRNVKSLFFIAISVLFGALFSLGVIVIFKSTVSIIAIGIASIIFGIAINYPLHFLAHQLHTGSTRQTLKEIVNPLLIGNITTVAAFLSLLFISSPAMKDLGMFASFLLVGTIFFVLIFLPQFTSPNHSKGGEHQSPKEVFSRLSEFSPEKNKFIVLLFLIFTVVLFFFSFGTKFETNLQEINYMTAEQRSAMNSLIAENQVKGKTLYVVAEGITIPVNGAAFDGALWVNNNDVLPLVQELKKDSLIISYSGIGNSFLQYQTASSRIDLWNEFWENRKGKFIKDFETISQQQGFNKGVFDDFVNILNANYDELSIDNYYYNNKLQSLAENYMAETDDGQFIYTILQCKPEHIEEVKKRIDDIDNGSVFYFDDTAIATKMVSALSDDFNNVLYICAFIVFIFLFFSFGRIEIAILTFIPMAVAWVWILGLMNIFDLKFNIVNIILATFIFGQGDDYTIFVTEGLMYEYTYRKKMLASFKNSIILSAAILFIAIGMLIFAKHPAMRSLAELTIVGMISVVMCAYLFPPLIFRYLTTKNGKPRSMPITLISWLKTVYAFLIFFIGTILMSLCGFFILTICGKTKRHKLLYHKILCAVFRLLSKGMPQVPNFVHNLSNETFEKPAIIICNHQSHIDLLYTLMLSPKIVALTNKWVWNCPFYGWIIRYADFLPIVDGIEQHADKLQDLIADGYSILVFPEGTRSVDCSINRFHKGAFYLAEKFGLDIIPLVMHGVGHALPKTEFILRKGRVDVEIHKRMNVRYETDRYETIRQEENEDCRTSYIQNIELRLLEISKYFRSFYQKKYAELSEKIETPEYYRDLVLQNYIYKGITIARNAKKNLKQFDNLVQQIDKLPKNGEITIQNCGQGEYALLAALVRKNLIINVLEENEEIFELAKNCPAVPKNLVFRYREIT